MAKHAAALRAHAHVSIPVTLPVSNSAAAVQKPNTPSTSPTAAAGNAVANGKDQASGRRLSEKESSKWATQRDSDVEEDEDGDFSQYRRVRKK